MSGVAIAGRAPSPARGAESPRRERTVLVALLVLAAALRIAWSLYAARTPQGESDPHTYLTAARGIAAGHGYLSFDGSPTAYFPIGYTAFLAAIVWVVDHTPLSDVPRTAAVVQ